MALPILTEIGVLIMHVRNNISSVCKIDRNAPFSFRCFVRCEWILYWPNNSGWILNCGRATILIWWAHLRSMSCEMFMLLVFWHNSWILFSHKTLFRHVIKTILELQDCLPDVRLVIKWQLGSNFYRLLSISKHYQSISEISSHLSSTTEKTGKQETGVIVVA